MVGEVHRAVAPADDLAPDDRDRPDEDDRLDDEERDVQRVHPALRGHARDDAEEEHGEDVVHHRRPEDHAALAPLEGLEVAEHPRGDPRARRGEGGPEEERGVQGRGGREPVAHPRRERDRDADDADEDRDPADLPQVGELGLEPDREEQEHGPELAKDTQEVELLDRDEVQRERPDEDARPDLADDGGKPPPRRELAPDLGGGEGDEESQKDRRPMIHPSQDDRWAQESRCFAGLPHLWSADIPLRISVARPSPAREWAPPVVEMRRGMSALQDLSRGQEPDLRAIPAASPPGEPSTRTTTRPPVPTEVTRPVLDGPTRTRVPTPSGARETNAISRPSP